MSGSFVDCDILAAGELIEYVDMSLEILVFVGKARVGNLSPCFASLIRVEEDTRDERLGKNLVRKLGRQKTTQ